MAITRAKKEDILQQLRDLMRESHALYFVQNTALTVAESRDLRARLRDQGCRFMTAKKTLIRKAIQEEYSVEIDPSDLPGSVSLCFALEEPISPAKSLKTFGKESEDRVQILAAYFEGVYLSESDAKALAEIPTKEELLAKMLGSMQAPLSNFVGVGNQLIAGFTRQLQSLSEKET